MWKLKYLELYIRHMAQQVKNPPAMQEIQETWVGSLSWEDYLEEKWQSTPVFSLGKFHEQRSLEGYSPRGHKEFETTEVTEHIYTHEIRGQGTIFKRMTQLLRTQHKLVTAN